MSSPPPALSRAAVRELDRRTIEEFGMPSFALMENAGRASADVAEELAGSGPFLVLIGPGNNGGDGLVVARTLVNRGGAARVLFPGDPAKLERASDDVRRNAALWRRMGGEVEAVEDEDAPVLAEALGAAALVVDGLFGTGLDRPLRPPYVGVVERVNAAGRPVLALDVPSGLHADEGRVLGAAVRAHTTVTFVAPKLGFEQGAGPEHCGRVVVAEIGIPRTLLEEAAASG